MVAELHTGSTSEQKSSSKSKINVWCLWQLQKNNSRVICFWSKTKRCQKVPKTGTHELGLVLVPTCSDKRLHTLSRERERKCYSSYFTDRGWRSCKRSYLLLLAVSTAAFSSQTKCRMALCHRHLLNDFLRQGQKMNPVRWSPKPPP